MRRVRNSHGVVLLALVSAIFSVSNFVMWQHANPRQRRQGPQKKRILMVLTVHVEGRVFLSMLRSRRNRGGLEMEGFFLQKRCALRVVSTPWKFNSEFTPEK